MMKYRVSHATTYVYSEPVPVSHNLVMITPRSLGHQRCDDHRLDVRPRPNHIERRVDVFGNIVHVFSIEENHQRLRIAAQSLVTVNTESADEEDSIAWEDVRDGLAAQTDSGWFDASSLLFDSPCIQRSTTWFDYAASEFTRGRPALAAAQGLNSKIHADFQYDDEATNVDTPLPTVFELRRGVCQDFAHAAIACFRSRGLAARYVSGYLRTSPPPGKPRLVGADASHAWVSVYLGPNLGWKDLDPTNNIFCGDDHIPVAWGRDYRDVVPVRGVFLGGGKHQLDVSVDVTPLP